MNAMLLPLEAVARAGGALVDRPRARVVHVTDPAARFTPGGRLRRGDRPLCNQPGRPCRRARFDGRPLCRRCIRAVLAHAGVVSRDQLTEARLRATLRTARTPDELHAAVRLLCLAPAGLTALLSSEVRDQRRRLGLDLPKIKPLPDQRPRGRRRPAWMEPDQ